MIRHDYAPPTRSHRRGWLSLYMALTTTAVLLLYVAGIVCKALY